MADHVIVGAGPVGSATARLLVAQGESVRLVTRRGTAVEGAEAVAADASDPAALTDLAKGARALYNCANPPYHRWPELWPPLHAALLAAAEASGAVLVITSNLYGYGPVTASMTEETPLGATNRKTRIRADMWRSALAAHEAGRLRATEARSSDYLGAGVHSLFTDLVLPRVLAGRTATVPADLDVPHSWTYVGDVARTLVTLATDHRAWGRPWHVPTNAPCSIRELAAEAARLAGKPAPRLRRMPDALLALGGLFSPMGREFRKVQYQFTAPFVLDSSAATRTFGLTATPQADALRTMVGF